MIDEAIGKILGMAMAYGVSALGLFLAYVNYRKRTLGAERVMTPAAWGVVAAVVLAIVVGVLVVADLARSPAPPSLSVTESVAAEEEGVPPAVVSPPSAPASPPSAPAGEEAGGERARWPLVGVLLPALIFLAATWITAALYRHFSRVDPAAGMGEPRDAAHDGPQSR